MLENKSNIWKNELSKNYQTNNFYTVNLLNNAEVKLYLKVFIIKLNNGIFRLLLKVITLKIHTIYNSSCMSNYVFYPIEHWDK